MDFLGTVRSGLAARPCKTSNCCMIPLFSKNLSADIIKTDQMNVWFEELSARVVELYTGRNFSKNGLFHHIFCYFPTT